MSDFDQFISPVSRAEFLRDYWEKKPLIVGRDAPDYYANLLNLRDLDALLNDSSQNSSHIQAVRDGKPRTLEPNRSGLGGAGPEPYYEEYRAGSTLVFQALHQRWPALRTLCGSLAREFSAGTQVNVYLTPANSQGFSAHYDTHDVFVVQVHGHKRWQIFERQIESPLHGQSFKAGDRPLGKPLREVDLTAGSLLYLPRGYVHSAVSGDSASVHLAVGVLTVTWAATLLGAVESAIEQEPRFRESLPPGFARDDVTRRGAVEHLGKMLKVLAANLDCDAAVAEAVTRVRQALPVDLAGQLLDIDLEQRIDSATRVRVRHDSAAELMESGEEVSLDFHGKRVSMPGRVRPVLQYILRTPEMCASDLPDALDDAGKLVLVRRLVREGYLTIVDGRV